MNKVTLGGDRLGSGAKMKVTLNGFERSNHDLSYVFRSTMSAGTVVPFMVEVGLPGDTIDIDLQALCLTVPSVGPLFGSYKIQYDIFQVPIRLYNSWLHNNRLDIGNNMSSVLLPNLIIESGTPFGVNNVEQLGVYEGWEQINPSCLLAYLGIRGVGNNWDITSSSYVNVPRTFNGTSFLAYWEIYKNYYSNKQEEEGVMVDGYGSSPIADAIATTTSGIEGNINAYPDRSSYVEFTGGGTGQNIVFQFSSDIIVPTSSIWLLCGIGDNPNLQWINLQQFGLTFSQDNYQQSANFNYLLYPDTVYVFCYWYQPNGIGSVNLTRFSLKNIDTQRANLLATQGSVQFTVNDINEAPYSWLNEADPAGNRWQTYSQQGLGIKTYQSDIFNNWLNESWIESIAAQSAVSTLTGSFTIDDLTIKKKVWELLNRIAVSGGSFIDWIDATYDVKGLMRAESPMYIGGMSQELVFNQIVSLAASGDEPLGQLAGRGNINPASQKGGKIIAKCDEHCYLMGMVSITPRLDYSQGNRWDTLLETMDDFHKPSLDEIGFQDLITDQMAWFDTTFDFSDDSVILNSAGKQPAWMNYMTNFNRTFGNFAIPNNEMFMTLNRRYEFNGNGISDLTTYIDPSKFNYIFADTRIDAQNFWMQIGVNIEARRKMSAKIMPNL